MDEKINTAIRKLKGYWPQSSECNGLLHYDWCNNNYYSDFYGSNGYVQLVCTKEEFMEARRSVDIDFST